MARTTLITGGAGFIGAHLASQLLEAGESVRVLDSLPPQVHPARTRPGLLPRRRGGAARTGPPRASQLLEAGESVRVLDSLLPQVHAAGTRPGYLHDDVEL